MVVGRVDIVEMLEHEIEWPTLIFFMMLFIVVAGAEETGLIQIIADRVKDVSRRGKGIPNAGVAPFEMPATVLEQPGAISKCRWEKRGT
ncbi:MAG: hypothetical protein KBH99_02815 [Syntrophobacteraceae bacterium]|nr:hypothetical protein [Syntrophobacteraceae bacterium]